MNVDRMFRDPLLHLMEARRELANDLQSYDRRMSRHFQRKEGKEPGVGVASALAPLDGQINAVQTYLDGIETEFHERLAPLEKVRDDAKEAARLECERKVADADRAYWKAADPHIHQVWGLIEAVTQPVHVWIAANRASIRHAKAAIQQGASFDEVLVAMGKPPDAPALPKEG